MLHYRPILLSHNSATTAFRIQLLLKIENASLEMGFRMTFLVEYNARRRENANKLKCLPSLSEDSALHTELDLDVLQKP